MVVRFGYATVSDDLCQLIGVRMWWLTVVAWASGVVGAAGVATLPPMVKPMQPATINGKVFFISIPPQ